MLRLGSLELKSKVLLCPLERVSDVGFRRLCHQQGAALTFTEMIYCSELAKNKSELVDTFDRATPTGIQLLVDRTAASDDWGVTTLNKALKRLEEAALNGERPEWQNIQCVDLNFGCPALSLAKRGAGPAQLRRRSKIQRLFETLAEWRERTPLKVGAVGAKIRLGLDGGEQKYKVYLPVAEAAVKGGLDYLVVHARHAKERSRDSPTWSAIAEVKQLVGADLVVVGNGDVVTLKDLLRMHRKTGCDAVMVGRAAMKDPWSLNGLINEHYQPTVADVDVAYSEYLSWSANRAAYDRYKPFHEENFERLRKLALERKEAAGGPAADSLKINWQNRRPPGSTS